MVNVEDLNGWSLEKLNRKIDQEYEMFSLAASDRDHADAARHMALVHLYKAEIEERMK